MAGAKGYSSYRGRGAKWKILLAALLILVILAALAVLYLQQHIVYDEHGRPQVDLPWLHEDPASDPEAPSETGQGEPDGVELIVQEPETPPATAARSLPAGPVTMEQWAQWKLAHSTDETAGAPASLALTLKASGGTIYFDAEGAVSRTVQTEEDTAAALASINAEQDLYTIARFSCLHDPRAANSNVRGMGLRNTGGYIFYDGNNSQWLDPTKPAAREYLCALAVQAAELGFDELMLTDLSYPTEGKINKINYNGDGPLSENLALLVTELKTALAPYEITLSLELPEAVVLLGSDEVSGQDLKTLAPLVGKIYAPTEPERIEALTSAVTSASETTLFVPELAADSEDLTMERLILPEET